jgi:purine nucleosidase
MRSVLAKPVLFALFALAASTPVLAQKRLIIIDQDTSGPGGSNIMSMLVLLQSPQVEVLGITVVTGNAWRDDEARHALRMLELIGRNDVPVALGAVFPLIRTQQETRLMTPLVGNVAWLGAWGQRLDTLPAGPAGLVEPPKPAAPLGPWDTPPLAEGEPHTKPIAEDAAHFLI